MRRPGLLIALLALLTSPALAQTDPHAGHHAPPVGQPAQSPPAADPHAGHVMPPAEAAPDPHAGHVMGPPPGPALPPIGADTPGRSPETPPPAAAFAGPAHAADLYFDPGAMAAARDLVHFEHGGMPVGMVIADRLEAGFGEGHDSYLWDVQGWYGGDINRVWWKSEGEGGFGEDLEHAEIQALYSRAVTPWWDVQAGVRADLGPRPRRSHLVLGVQGLAPYFFEIDAAAFVSDEGELTARVEAEYDLRLTQRLILQPRAEAVLSARDIPELAIGSGLSSVEIGARLRYELAREFAPYVGVEWSGGVGETRDLLRVRGDDPDEARIVVGIRAWY